MAMINGSILLKNIICNPVFLFTTSLFFLSFSTGFSQMITGTWKGKINRQKTEVKIIQSGDSLTGTSYYYESPGNYRRYSIKGYFDEETNTVVWWDDQLLEEKSTRFNLGTPGKVPSLSRADFNCPGGGRMMLDGNAFKKENETEPNGEVHLDKTQTTQFEDEWDFVIENYTVGANDPYIIDSIGAIAFNNRTTDIITKPVTTPEPVTPEPVTQEPVVAKPVAIAPPKPESIQPVSAPVITAPGIEEKFVKREKKLVKEIPVRGDSLELRFYDNGEIDGDSISLFLNGKLIFEHIRLTGNAYSIKLALKELPESNELTMVAENLGSIPPNTSYMLAINDEKRYEAYLFSNEGSSAMIRFVKKD